MKFDELRNKLLQQDIWKKQFSSSSETEGLKQGFVSNFKGKGKWTKKKGQSSGDNATQSHKDITCHFCGKARHMKKIYIKRLIEQKINEGGFQ